MSRRAFTLVEVLLVLVLIGILGTLGFPAYQNFIEDSKAKACQAHLEALKGALDMYALDLGPNDTMPATLGQLPAKYIEASYARLMQKKDAWKIRLACFILSLQEGKLAYAEPLPMPLISTIVKGNATLLVCPADHNPQGHGNISYALNAKLAGMHARDYLDKLQLPDDTVLIGDSDSSSHIFSKEEDLVSRHVDNKIFSRVNYAQGITKIKKISKPKTGILPSAYHSANRFSTKYKNRDNDNDNEE